MRDEPQTEPFADRYSPVSLWRFDVLKIVPAAFAVKLHGLSDADLAALYVTPTQGEIFLGTHPCLEGELKYHAAFHLTAQIREYQRLGGVHYDDIRTFLCGPVGVFAGIEFERFAFDGPAKAGVEARVQVADGRRRFVASVVDALDVLGVDLADLDA